MQSLPLNAPTPTFDVACTVTARAQLTALIAKDQANYAPLHLKDVTNQASRAQSPHKEYFQDITKMIAGLVGLDPHYLSLTSDFAHFDASSTELTSPVATDQAEATESPLSESTNTDSEPQLQLEALPQEMLAEIAKHLASWDLSALAKTNEAMGCRLDEIASRTLLADLQEGHNRATKLLASVEDDAIESVVSLQLRRADELVTHDPANLAGIEEINGRYAQEERNFHQLSSFKRHMLTSYLHDVKEKMAENGHSLVTFRDA